MAKLTFLGSGSAFCLNNYQSNMLLETDSGEKLLIDCGSDARHALCELGLSHKDVCAVYISHVHADHTGGLEWLGICRRFDPTCEKPILITHCMNTEDLWGRALSGGMRGIASEVGSFESFFDVRSIQEGHFAWGGIDFKMELTHHLSNPAYLLISAALSFSVREKKILITTDSKGFGGPGSQEFYQGHDIIFHDCETAPFKTGCHAHYDDLCLLSDQIRKKMWLYHYQDGELPDAQLMGFAGFVKKGQVFAL